MTSLPRSTSGSAEIAFTPEIITRFWSKVQRVGPGDCWNWTACRTKDPSGNLRYGLFGVYRKNRLAHRVAYMISNGNIPDGLFVCHSCDNPACCNPSHMFLGTPDDNMKDKVAKGRQSHCGTRTPNVGETSPHAKLTDEKVRLIRSIYKQGHTTVKQIARDFGVAQSLIARVVRRQSWKHVVDYPTKSSHVPGPVQPALDL